MADFEPAYEFLMPHEVINYHAPGQVWYSNTPGDSGGKTAWGITEATARLCGFMDPMETMLEMDALKIYRSYYWQYSGINSQRVASKLFDHSVNMDNGILPGKDESIKLMQWALEFEGADLDGQYGPQTEAAINAANPDVLLERYVAELVEKYQRIADKHPEKRKFLKTWLRRAHELPEE